MPRREGWEDRFAETIARHAAMPFAWGVNDCFVLCLDVARALTGEDPWGEERGTYSNEVGARLRLARHGCLDLAEAFAMKFAEHDNLAAAHRGDIGVAEVDGELVGVVVLGADVLGVAPNIGVTRVPRDRLRRAFKVG